MRLELSKMPIGAFIRSLFGPYERQISNAYRAIYVNLDDFVSRVVRWSPSPARILEVGCGEGAVTERLCKAYPEASITGIDISPRVGRLYHGAAGRVRFIQCTLEELRQAESGKFDLIILADVLHHVPGGMRAQLLGGIRDMLAPGGSFVFKEWERNHAPICWLSYLSDRWLTGDRIRFLSRTEAREQIATSFGASALIEEARVAPWRNNLAMLVRA
jgi:2-polyprenyl-6-hydroxyphenyl methylase/3-demethylubiquinone-9 3-methyltransferase